MRIVSEKSNRIYFDTTFLHYEDYRGVYQVIMQLIILFRDNPQFSEIEFIASQKIWQNNLKPLGISESRVIMMPPLPFIGQIERFHGFLSSWKYRHVKRTARLIIHPEFRTVIDSDIPQAVMLHDFIVFEPVAIGGKRKISRYFYFYLKYRRAMKAKYLWANSEFTRSRALHYYPEVKPDKITVLPLAARKSAAGSGAAKSLLSESIIHFLYVGSFEYRKNVLAMVCNFSSMNHGLQSTLHLAGFCSHRTRRALNSIIQEKKLESEIIVYGNVDDELLRKLYDKAHFFLFPSLMEGFGMPLLEAMSHGLVVCAFRNSAIPEAAGDAALLAENNDFRQWGTDIVDLVQNPSRYRERSLKSIKRAGEFSDDRMMALYGDYFKKLIDLES